MIDLSQYERMPPFVGIQAKYDKILDSGRSFRLIVYAGYEAMGLIETEHNGVAILDLDRGQVLCDEIARAEFGDAGATPEQWAEFGRLIAMTDGEFIAFVNAHPRHRYPIGPEARLTFDQLTPAQQEQARARFQLGDPQAYVYELGSTGDVLSRRKAPQTTNNDA